jgi:hypothetical protein
VETDSSCDETVGELGGFESGGFAVTFFFPAIAGGNNESVTRADHLTGTKVDFVVSRDPSETRQGRNKRLERMRKKREVYCFFPAAHTGKTP